MHQCMSVDTEIYTDVIGFFIVFAACKLYYNYYIEGYFLSEKGENHACKKYNRFELTRSN